MGRRPPSASPSATCRSAGFTLVELLVAVALSVVVLAILGLVVHSLLQAREKQEYRIRNSLEARTVIRGMVRDLMAAYVPPGTNYTAMELSTSTDPDAAETTLVFYSPSSREWGDSRWFDIEKVTYEVKKSSSVTHQLYRNSSPCSGPYTNTTPQLLLEGPFTLGLEAITNQTEILSMWPPDDSEEARHILPQAMRLNLTWNGTPIQTDVLIQAAQIVTSTIVRTPISD